MKIRYAGYDPNEDDWNAIEAACVLDRKDYWGHVKRTYKTQIDGHRAMELLASGMCRREVGIKLAEEQGRVLPFTADGITAAIKRVTK
jgi:hypothetical protein